MKRRLIILSAVLTTGGVLFGTCSAIAWVLLYVFGSGVGNGISLLVFLWASGDPKGWEKVWDSAEEMLDQKSS